MVETKNRIVKEMAKTMLNEASLSDTYWKEVVHIATYTLNQVQLRTNSKMTPYELWYDWKPSVKHFKVFGIKFFIKKDLDGIGSFDSRSGEGIFLGYSSNIKAYKCYNKRLRRVIESVQ